MFSRFMDLLNIWFCKVHRSITVYALYKNTFIIIYYKENVKCDGIQKFCIKYMN